MQVFDTELDFKEFVKLLTLTKQRLDIRLLGFCLMPNHIHLLVRPYEDNDLSRWMHRLLTSHVRRHHKRHGTDGHIWQGRFKAFAIEEDHHYLTVLRYVERNPLRAGLVDRAELWPWSSLHFRSKDRLGRLLAQSPVPLFDDWKEWINQPQTAAELEGVRQCVQRGRPFGNEAWTRQTAQRLRLQSTLRALGRPRDEGNKI